MPQTMVLWYLHLDNVTLLLQMGPEVRGVCLFHLELFFFQCFWAGSLDSVITVILSGFIQSILISDVPRFDWSRCWGAPFVDWNLSWTRCRWKRTHHLWRGASGECTEMGIVFLGEACSRRSSKIHLASSFSDEGEHCNQVNSNNSIWDSQLSTSYGCHCFIQVFCAICDSLLTLSYQHLHAAWACAWCQLLAACALLLLQCSGGSQAA